MNGPTKLWFLYVAATILPIFKFTVLFLVNHCLRQGQTYSGQLRDWFVKKLFLYATNKKVKESNSCWNSKWFSEEGLVFLIALTVYREGPIFMFFMETANHPPKKTVKLDSPPSIFNLDSWLNV